MDKKTTGIIATVATTLLCGCPGLLAACMGIFYAVISFIPGAELDTFGSSDPGRALTTGIGVFCLGTVFVAIPVIVGIVMLRKKPNQEPTTNEPIPPAI